MQLKSRFIALPLAAVLASGALFSVAPAEAAPKSKTYKAGAVALGVLGAYLLSKGKTVEGAAALGGGYLAYKQGEKDRKNEKYGDRYGRYDSGKYGNDRYDNGHYDNSRQNNWNTGRDNGSYNNGNGAYYNGNASYNSGSDYHYNDNLPYDNSRASNGTNNSDRDCREQGQGNGLGRDNGQHRSNGRSWQR